MNKILGTLLAGVAIGIFIAPAKGSETWRKLLGKLDEYSDKGSDEASKLYKAGKRKFEEGKSAVEDAARKI